MEKRKLQLFASEVFYQCNLMIAAGNALDQCSHLTDWITQSYSVFYHLPVLLSGAAGVSKTLWAQKEGRARDQRLPLRDHFKQSGSSPFSPNGAIGRSMRNNYEHFDERLDKWWDKKGQNSQTYIEKQVLHGDVRFLGLDDTNPPVPPFEPTLFSNIPGMHENMFRAFNVDTQRIMFWGQSLDMKFVVAEAKILLSIPLPL